MNDALYIAATGLQAQKQHVDTIANNLANVSTPGFKRGSVQFQDLMQREAAQELAAGLPSPHAGGMGVGVTAAVKAFEPGELQRTDNPMHLAVRGDGFIEVLLTDGSTAYTRGGGLMVNQDGMLATIEGHELRPAIRVGRDVRDLQVAPDGTVTGADGNRRVELGRLELTMFGNPGGLKPLGQNVYAATTASGDAMPVRAGEEGQGAFAHGYQEASNVRLVDEMVTLMVAQRAYEMNVKVIQAADEMLGMSNNLRR